MARSIVEISGHIIDSLILPKILDLIVNLGAEFEILDIQIGHRRADRSHARVQVEASSEELLAEVLAKIREHGALPVEGSDEPARLDAAPEDGIFPEAFYATTNLPTQVRVNGRWIEVEAPEMDCAIRVDGNAMRAETVPVHKVRKGDSIVVGHQGIKIVPLERSVPHELFEFMSSAVSTEQPKGLLIREIAETMKNVRQKNGKILAVAGPSLVHTSAAPYLRRPARTLG